MEPRVLRLFQLTPSHTEEALVLVALAFTAVASTVVQRYGVEWPWALELLRSVLLELTGLIAADIVPIDRAELLQDCANLSASSFALRLGWGTDRQI